MDLFGIGSICVSIHSQYIAMRKTVPNAISSVFKKSATVIIESKSHLGEVVYIFYNSGADKTSGLKAATPFRSSDCKGIYKYQKE